MARPRSATYDDQRERILDRAAALFAERGYAGTSMNEVAAACGLSKPALYHYFRDKDALLLQIAEAHVLQLGRTLQAALDRTVGQAPAERLRALIEGLVGDYAGAQNAHRVLTEDVRFLPDADRERLLDHQRRLVRAFAAPIAALRPEAAGAQAVTPLTMLLFGMVNWMFTWHRDDGPLSHQALAPMVAELFTAGVAAVTLPATAPAGSAAPRSGPAAMDPSPFPPGPTEALDSGDRACASTAATP